MLNTWYVFAEVGVRRAKVDLFGAHATLCFLPHGATAAL